jgi:hypothetical protein
MKNKRKALLFILLGLGIQALGFSLYSIDSESTILYYASRILFPLGQSSFIAGCCYWARAKGWHWMVGFVGILNLFGLLVLAQLHDIPGAAEE